MMIAMKIKRLLRLKGALLTMLLAICCAIMAHADLTIKVQKGGEAPYLYAFTGSGSNATEYKGAWPGTQFSEKDGDGSRVSTQ